MSNDKKLISPIRPEPYGDRFLRFIEGVTKSPEEATREAAAAPPRTNSNTISMHDGPTHDTPQRKSLSTHNSTLARNEKEAVKSEMRGESEDAVEPRVISTARSPSADRSGGMQGQTLPVVEELGEASSTGGRSGRSGRSERSLDRPVTPTNDGRPRTPAKDYNGNGNEASVRKSISRNSLDKDLPPLPRVDSPQRRERLY